METEHSGVGGPGCLGHGAAELAPGLRAPSPHLECPMTPHWGHANKYKACNRQATLGRVPAFPELTA